MTMTNKILYLFNRKKLVLPFNLILWFLLLITSIALFVPFSPRMPAAGLDPSWVFGINQALSQGLSFGKEMIFTYGPYASIYTKSYHPSTDLLMISGGLYLALSFWLYLVLLMKGVQWIWVLVFCVILAGLMQFPDALFFSLPLLVGLVTFKIIDHGSLIKSKLAPFFVVLIFSPFGLLPLIKGSMLIMCGAIAALCAVFFIANRQKLLAILCLCSPIVSMLLFWIASGQSVAVLPSYFVSMAAIASGYTEAMAVDGNVMEVILYIIASAFLLIAIATQKQITITSKVFLLCTFFVFLFLSFKAGFVRHDAHAIVSGTSILLAAFLLPFIANSRIILPALLFTLVTWSYIDSNYLQTSTAIFFNNVESTYSTSWYGIKNRIENKNWLKTGFDTAVNTLRTQASFPVFSGTTDIYSYNQSYLISSGNHWSPRPVLQSYSSYTPALAEADREHLLGLQAPDNIIFAVEPIDGRLPSIEDGASWPILITNYQPSRLTNEFLFLRKRDSFGEIAKPLKLASEQHTFGESVNLPHSNEPIFAQIEIKPTILGRLANIFFKPSQLRILLELNNGTKKQFRIISGMIKSDFLISPLIENTTEFGMLYGKNYFLNEKLVKSITIAPGIARSILWNNEYTIAFSQIETKSPNDLSKLYKFDSFNEKLSGTKVITAEKCEGSMDVVNGTSPLPAKLTVSGLLKVNGWLAASVEKALLPEAVYVVLTDAKGKHQYLNTHATQRPDVGAYFKKTELNNSGYTTMADISGLEGEYTLGLAIKYSNKLKICPQFNTPSTITK